MNEKDFPCLNDELVYLDSACMSFRPQRVIEKVQDYYTDYSGCSGRSGHSISRRAEQELENARAKIASFIGASKSELMFTSGTTEAINTVAQGLDFERVFLTEKEHNSNRAVWQELGVETVNMADLDLEFLEKTLGEKDLVSVLHVSNLDGEILDVETLCKISREKQAYTLIDAAQSISHGPFSVREIDADFVAFSGHKMLGPTGTGGLYVAERVQEELEPLKYGGGAVIDSSLSTNSREDFPHGFEPGLKNIAGFTGLGAAVDYLESIGMRKVLEHEEELTVHLVSELESMNVKIFNKGPGIVSVVPESMSSNEAAEIMDLKGIKVRSGQHCVHPWFKNKDFDSTLRVSLHLYNSKRDVEAFLKVMRSISAL